MKAYLASLKSPGGCAALSLRLHGDTPMDAVREYFSRHYPDLKIIGITEEKLNSENCLADYWIEHSGREINIWRESFLTPEIHYNDRISVDKEI